MSPELQKEFDLIEEIFPNTHGWCTPEKGKYMAEAVFFERPRLCVEIGVFGGRSLIAMGCGLRACKDSRGYAVGVDPWETQPTIEGMPESDPSYNWWRNVDMDDIHRQANESIKRHGLQEYCGVIRAKAESVPMVFSQIDILHIDGCHSIVPALRDVAIYTPLLRRGGILIFDDADWETTKPAQIAISATCQLIDDQKSYRVYRKM